MKVSHPHDERRSNLPLKQTLSRHWFRFQRELFPWLEEALGPLGERYERLVRVEEWLPYSRGWRGRPLKDRAALARAFLAKAVLDVPTTRGLVERLRTEPTLRRLCGREAAGGVPSEATFSRAFAEFAASDLPGRLHEALLDRTLKGHLAGHVSRDSTAIPGRESPAPKPAPTARPKRRRGRPRKNERRAKEPRRLERQASMTLEQMLEDLPKVCDIGVKRNAKGHQESWTGYKLHIDPRRRPQVKAERKREALAQRRIGQVSPEVRRTRERSTVERVNGWLKDEFGGRYLRVRGPGKVWCHLMFGILALTVEQLMRLTL